MVLSKGTYVLILSLNADRWIRVGRLGRISFLKGFYAYIGSAFGPGGLTARLRYHLKAKIHQHWHIDALAAHADVVEIWYAEQHRHEHLWAAAVAELLPTASPVVGFGCSDCGCLSHLIYFPKRPLIKRFNRYLLKHPAESIGAQSLVPRHLRESEKYNRCIHTPRMKIGDRCRLT